MLSSNHFREQYKTISNAELLTIIQNPDEYQPLAVEAAEKEMATRLLSESEISQAKKEVEEKQSRKELQNEKTKAIQSGIKRTTDTIFDNINPIQSGIPTTEKTVRSILIAFAVIFLLRIIIDFNVYVIIIKGFDLQPVHNILYLTPVIIHLLGIYCYWKRESVGWSLLTVYTMYSIASWTLAFIFFLVWESSGNAEWGNLFPRPPLLPIILQLLFYIGMLSLLCKKAVRDIFTISNNKMIRTIITWGIAWFFTLYIAVYVSI